MKGRAAARRAATLALALPALAIGASPAGAARLSPVSHSFGNQNISTASAPRAFTLTAGCNFELLGTCPSPEMFSTSISVGTTEFLQTNDCPSVLVGSVAGTSCTINVTFTPQALGPRQDTLRAGAGGPTAPLTGDGVLPPANKNKCKRSGKKGRKGKKGKKRAAAAKKKCRKKKGKPRPVIEPLSP
jgi:hypothetical protein